MSKNGVNGGSYNINTTLKRDKTGLLGKILIEEPDVIYMVAEIRDHAKFGFATIRICNLNELTTTDDVAEIIIWISTASQTELLEQVDITEYKLKLAGTASLVLPGYTLSTDEKVYVKSSKGLISVRVEGSENNPL